MLTILIATVEDGIDRLEKTIEFRHPSVRYLVVQQTISPRVVPDYLQRRRDVEVIRSVTRGLAISRNIGLYHCQTRYALIADDDVEFVPDGMLELLDIIERDKPDFALFQIETPDGQPEYKDYPKEAYQVKYLRHWVSSIEIVVNASKVQQEQLRFDERFGLGTELNRGEEDIFVSDLIQHDWEGGYFPIPIVRHPYESSGKYVRTQKEQFFFQGAYDTRMGIGKVPIPTVLDCLLRPSSILSAIHYRRGMRYIERTEEALIDA